MAEMKSRVVRVSDLAAEAAGVPPSMKERADNLRIMAKIMRESSNQKTIRVWEEQEGTEGPDFIRPDPASY